MISQDIYQKILFETLANNPVVLGPQISEPASMKPAVIYIPWSSAEYASCGLLVADEVSFYSNHSSIKDKLKRENFNSLYMTSCWDVTDKFGKNILYVEQEALKEGFREPETLFTIKDKIITIGYEDVTTGGFRNPDDRLIDACGLVFIAREIIKKTFQIWPESNTTTREKCSSLALKTCIKIYQEGKTYPNETKQVKAAALIVGMN